MSAFLDADYSAIEARIVCWLAGQEDALEEYRQGVDRYKRMASFIYGVPESEVNKHPQRFVGKQATLGCGFQMGPPKFRLTCMKMGGYDLPQGLEEKAVKAFRERHKAIVRLWAALDVAARQAINFKGDVFKPVPKHFRGENPNTPLPTFQNLQFTCKDIKGMNFLLLILPSGRKLAYPKPKIVPSKRFEDSTSVAFFGHILGTKWGDVDTFGAKFLENATQAVAADVMVNGAHNCERAGYQIATLIHDECLTYQRQGQTAERLVELLTDLPEWSAGLPIAAEGAEVKFYKK